MIIRRMYLKTKRYAWYFHPEITTLHDMMEFSKNNPSIEIEKLDNATYFMTKLTREEQKSYWKQSYNLVMNHTRWVLDNLDNMIEYKTGWNNYGSHNGTTIGKPPEIQTYTAKTEEDDETKSIPL